MPPPTIATSTAMYGIGASPVPSPFESCPHQILEHADEQRRCIQRLRPPQRRRKLAGDLSRLHIDIEQDLGVVADETDRNDEELANADGAIVDDLRHLRSDPRFGCAARALKR